MIVLISGGIAVGKSTVAMLLAETYGGRVVRVRQALAGVLGIAADDRAALQREGVALDRRTAGRWLVDYLQSNIGDEDLVVVDALRTRRQTEPVLNHLEDVHLVHLKAHEATRRRRYAIAAKTDRLKAGVPYDAAVAHETERQADEVQDLAEVVLPTDDLTEEQTIHEIAQRLGLRKDR